MQIWQKLFFPADISWLWFPQQQAWLAVPSCWRRAPYLQSHESKRVAIGKGGRKLFGLASRKDQIGSSGRRVKPPVPCCPLEQPQGKCHWELLRATSGGHVPECLLKKVFIEFITILFLFYVVVFQSQGMCDPSSLWTRMELAPSTLEGDDLTIGPPWKSRVS